MLSAKPLGILGLVLSLFAITALAVLLTAVIAGAMALLATLALGPSAFLGALNAAMRDSDTIAAMRMMFLLIIAFYVAVALAIVIAARFRGKSQWRDLIGWHSPRLRDVWIWVIMVAALIYSAGADALIGHFFPHAPEQLSIPSDRFAYGELFVLAVILAPIAEELLFRGWIYTALRVRFGLWMALLTSSALFAFAHYEGTHLYALAVFPIGLALGVIRERTGSLKASIGYHAFNNLAAFCLAALGSQ
ncbi:MAG TPA: type II CAAX endopeptidase family protein [Methylovirgula sp.]